MRGATAVLIIAALLGACSSKTPPNYVALGDSFTSGPYIPSSEGPPGCLRSDHNYPHIVAAALGARPFRDASCSGATTESMAGPQATTDGTNPPQLDSLDPATSLVTIGIGGNDIGFIQDVEGCTSVVPAGTVCQDRYVVNGNDTIGDRITATRAKVAAALDAIHQRSPHARVFVIGYPAMLPVAGNGCWPQLPFAPADVPYLRSKVLQLNTMLADAASVGGAAYVDLYTPSTNHDACQWPGTRWIEPLLPAAEAVPFHPNATGMAAIGGVVRTAIAAH